MLAGHQIVDVATGQFAEPRNQVMRKQRSLFVFFVPLERDSERFSHERLRLAHRLARFLHASDETVIKFEFRIIEGHNQYCRRPFRHLKGQKSPHGYFVGEETSPRVVACSPSRASWAVRAEPSGHSTLESADGVPTSYSSTLLDAPNALEAANIEFLPGNGSRLREPEGPTNASTVPSPIEL